MNKNFIPDFLDRGYELKKECRIDITSCVNYTYYIVHNVSSNDLLLLKDTHACHATTPPEQKVIHLEDMYSALYWQMNHLEKIKSTTYEKYEYKKYYRDSEHYQTTMNDTIKWYQEKVNLLQDFITTYLDLLKSQSKN